MLRNAGLVVCEMGCVFGKEVSSEAVVEKEERSLAAAAAPVLFGRKEQVRVAQLGEDGEVQNGDDGKEKEEEGHKDGSTTTRRAKGERRRSSKPNPNPRLSNPPKNVHGEQVAAGWPAWLSAVAGEAINGWTPRRADTFEKLDKVK